MCALGWIPWLDTGVGAFVSSTLKLPTSLLQRTCDTRGKIMGFVWFCCQCVTFFCAEDIFRQWTAICLFSWEMLRDVGKILEGMTEIYPRVLTVLTVEF